MKQLLRETSGEEEAAPHLPGAQDTPARGIRVKDQSRCTSPPRPAGGARPCPPASGHPAVPMGCRWSVPSRVIGVFVPRGMSAHSFLTAQRTLAPPSRPGSGAAASGSDSDPSPAWRLCGEGARMGPEGRREAGEARKEGPGGGRREDPGPHVSFVNNEQMCKYIRSRF